MRRLVRPAAFVGVSAAALIGFVLAGRLSADPVSTSDLRGWLDRADPVDALTEIARLIGIVLAAYVAIVSFVAVLAEAASAVRLPRVHRDLRRLVGFVALPELRRRLLEFTTVATVAVSSLHAIPAGAASAPRSIALVVDTPASTPSVGLRGEFQGFGVSSEQSSASGMDAIHTVRKGDTLSQILVDKYGRFDADLLRRVLAANPQIADPNLILVGWNIVLPEPALWPQPLPAPPTVQGEASWAVVTVEHGDTLWDIVDRHYGHATAELVWATVAANPDVEDPNLIFAGQQITLPPTTDQSLPTTPTAEPGPLPPPVAATPPVAEPRQPTVVVGSKPVSTEGPLPPPTTPAVTSTPLLTVVASTETAEAPSAPIAEPDTSDTEVGPSLAQLIGWTGSAGLAAALLALAARRRHRLPLDQRVRRPSKRAVRVGVALRETENLSTVEWTAGALRTLAARLRPRPGEPTPVPRLLRLAGDEIELVWDTPNVESPAPWQTPDGGWSWTLKRVADLSTADNPNPCPCLVTVGRREGADVLLNLESCGALAISGDASVADALWRSIATELACSVFSDSPTVLLVGLDHLVGQPDHARSVELGEAVGWLRDRADAAGALLAHRRLTSLFALRARSRPQDGHEPVVVVVNPERVDEDELVTLVGLANGDLGAVVIVAGAAASVTWQLRCTTDTVGIDPLGLTLDPVGFDADLEAVVSEIVPDPVPDEDDEGADDVAALQQEPVLADHLQLVERESPREPTVVDESEPTDNDWDVELKVLGQVRAVGTKQPLTPTELHLAIYLAFHRNGENSDTIATMVWPKGAAARTITNAMAGVRRKLGTGADGEMLFPLGRDNQYVYRLSRRVVTDWDRFITMVRRADTLSADEAVEVLDAALELVDGPPFRAPSGYSWAYSDGTATLMTETIKAVARRCIDLHLHRHELVEAGAAACRTARAIDAGVDDPLVTRVVAAFEQEGGEESANRLVERLGSYGSS
jgi:phage tail protein X